MNQINDNVVSQDFQNKVVAINHADQVCCPVAICTFKYLKPNDLSACAYCQAAKEEYEMKKTNRKANLNAFAASSMHDFSPCASVAIEVAKVYMHGNFMQQAANQNNFAPTYPSHGTQAARLLADLLQGQEVHPLRGWRVLGIYRLAAVKHALKKLGWPIEKMTLKVKNRFGEGCGVALYRLQREVIVKADKKGQCFAAKEFKFMLAKVSA